MSHFDFSHTFKGIADVFLRRPEYYQPLLGFLEQVMVQPSKLSKIEREVLAAYVSKLNGCHFCVKAHKSTLQHLGASEALLSSIDQDFDCAELTPSLAALLPFAKRLTENPKSVTKQHITSLKYAGMDEQTIEDAMNVVALFCLINRLVDAVGVSGAPAYFDMVGKALASNGYAKLLG